MDFPISSYLLKAAMSHFHLFQLLTILVGEGVLLFCHRNHKHINELLCATFLICTTYPLPVVQE